MHDVRSLTGLILSVSIHTLALYKCLFAYLIITYGINFTLKITSNIFVQVCVNQAKVRRQLEAAERQRH